jgi:hypothetical protein
MKRTDLEHIIRAAGSIVEDNEIIVVGSQSVLGQYPDAPESLIRSMEADIYPKNKHHLSDLIDGSIGELSPFHQIFSYYAHGVGKDTATLPDGWEQRLIPIQNDNTRGIIGWCLEIHDLLASKYVAGRERDLEFAAEAIRHGLILKDLLDEKIKLLPVNQTLKERFLRKIAAEFLDLDK